MKISKYIIALLIMGLLVFTIYSTISDLGSADKYNITIDMRYNKTYDKVKNITDIISNMRQDIANITPQEDAGFFTGAWNVVEITKTILFGVGSVTTGSIALGGNIISDTTNYLGVGSQDNNVTSGEGSPVFMILTGVLFIAILSAILSIVLKVEF